MPIHPPNGELVIIVSINGEHSDVQRDEEPEGGRLKSKEDHRMPQAQLQHRFLNVPSSSASY